MGAFFRFVDRTNATVPALLYLAVVGGALGALAATTEGGFIRADLTPRQFGGTAALFALLPALVLWRIPHQLAAAEEALEALRDVTPNDRWETVRRGAKRLGVAGALVALAIGPLLGLGNNPLFVKQIAETGVWHPLDVAFLLSAIGMWWVAGMMFCWRLPLSRGLSRLADAARLDLYRLDRLRPVARVGTSDALIVATVMAMSALQSLDAEFRIGAYWPTALIGLPAAGTLLLVPLWGARRNILRLKAARTETLRAELDTADRSDVPRLEALTAHLDRVRQIPSWPLDLQLASRLVAYFVLPPLAWVAAALVEGWIDRL